MPVRGRPQIPALGSRRKRPRLLADLDDVPIDGAAFDDVGEASSPIRPSVAVVAVDAASLSPPPATAVVLSADAPLPRVASAPTVVSAVSSSRPSSSTVATLPAPTLSRDLRQLGNEKAWKVALEHVTSSSKRQKPLVVWGPTGCGKTEGVRSLLRATRYQIVELDGAEAETTEKLIGWVKRARQTSGMHGSGAAVLLDDFESFTPDARNAIVKLLQKTPPKSVRLSPIVVTCTQVRHPDMKALQSFDAVRLFAPREHETAAWFERSFPASWVHGVRDLCAKGDLRRVHMALEWRRNVQKATSNARVLHLNNPASSSSTPHFANAFDATRRLLLRRCTADEWAHEAEPRDVDLLEEHLPAHVGNDSRLTVDALERQVLALDTFSSIDATQPRQFELRRLHAPHSLFCAAKVAHLTTRARDVGALAPRPRLVTASGPDTTPGQRPTPPDVWRDVPSLLRDRL